MVGALRLIFCIFLTSAFNSAWADYCFTSKKSNGVLPSPICFKEIRSTKTTNGAQAIYLKNQYIDDLFLVKDISETGAGYFTMRIQGDFINYNEKCGLNISSKFDFNFVVDSNRNYKTAPQNTLKIKYTYTPNNCTTRSDSGTELFYPVEN